MSSEYRRENTMEDNKYFEQTKYILNPTIHKCLYVLVKYLFFGKEYMRNAQYKLENFISKLNKVGLKFDKDLLYRNNCDIDSLKTIFKFIKSQNFALSTEIFENLIIRVLSFAFVTKNDEFFGKYLYNNIEELRSKNGKKLLMEWIDDTLLKGLFNDNNQTLNFALTADENLKNTDDDEKEDIIRSINLTSKQSTFLQILFYSLKNKNIIDRSTESQNLNTTTTTTITETNTQIYTQLSQFFYGSELGKKKRDKILTASVSILISTYIHYLNRKSPLMSYSLDKPNLEKIPFVFDLSEAGISDMYSNTILNPLRIEPRITDLELNKNRFDDYGMLELHRLLMFNKNIKKISLSGCTTKPIALNTFNDNFAPFDNYNVEELNMSSNYLKSDADINLTKLITYFKGLKILVLSHNILKSGLGYFFVTLKSLYRKGQSNLEELYLVNCELDDISLYELGELLKSKYCKLKCLCLNENKIPFDIDFFKALKKNRSLEEIYFYGCGIISEKTDEIESLINNTNLQHLYLYANKIHDFNQYIRILYKTKLVKNEKEKKKNIFIDNPDLFNLNMSNSDSYNQNAEKLDILLEGMKNTNLSILDLSSVLKEANNYDYNLNYKYYNTVNRMIDYLSKKQKEFKKALKEFLEIQLNNENNNNNLDNKDKKDFESFYINNIINPNFKHDTYIREKYNELFSDLSINKDKENENFQKLINYIHFKRDEILSEQNKKILESKKLIII